LRCEGGGLLYCGKLAFRVNALLVVLVNVCVRSIPALADAHAFFGGVTAFVYVRQIAGMAAP